MDAMIKKQLFSEKLGNAIRKRREGKGISLKQFEVLDASFDRAMLSRIENGHSTPNTYTLYKICQILEIKLSDLISDIEK